jgi:hypothetical protein
MKRNYLYFLIFMLTTICAIATQSGGNFNPKAILYPEVNQVIEKWWIIASYSLGVPLAITRLLEPYVWKNFKRTIYKFKNILFCKKAEDETKRYNDYTN